VPGVPKVLVSVGGRPFLEHILCDLARQGFHDVVLSTGFRSEAVREFGGDGSRWELRIRYSHEAEPLGTGGAVVAASAMMVSDPFLVLNGDTFVEIDWRGLQAHHLSTGATITMVVVPADDCGRYGAVLVDARDRVVGFSEKGQQGPGLVNAGAYVIARSAPTSWTDPPPLSLERQVLPRYVGRGLWSYRGQGRFVDIGTPEALAGAQHFFDMDGRG
jgi:NDP-sugar pyrophosphorylase family protein